MSYGQLTGVLAATASVALARRISESEKLEPMSKQQEMQDGRSLEEQQAVREAMAKERARIWEMKELLGYVPSEPLTRQQRRQLERKRAKAGRFTVPLATPEDKETK
tara:strand:+ start:2962 stop:3282 length:321 start_codon:yes stop_codon:yes gene_type:complete